MQRKKTFHLVFLEKQSLQVHKLLNIFEPFGTTTLPAQLFSDALTVLSKPLTELINSYLEEEKFPLELKLANEIALHKKIETENPTNYGPKILQLNKSRNAIQKTKCLTFNSSSVKT